jgi:diguanylate cyclase (GGDEF)-like protein
MSAASQKNDAAFSPATNPVLLKSPLLCHLSDLEFNAVTAFLERRRVKKGEAVFEEGDKGEDMFILLSGSLSAFVAQSDGTCRHMFDIKCGDFFGEMSIVANEPRSATITAKEDSEVMVLQGIDFYRFVYELPMIGVKLLKAISSVQNQWLNQSSKSYSDLMRWGETARRRAITDDLTGLYNRRFLEESLKDRFDHGSVGLRKISLMMMDLDKVHLINDRHGPKGGDRVIIAVSEVLRSVMRSGDIAARLSGDEFSVLLPDTDLEEVCQVAERIRESVQQLQVEVPQSPGSDKNISISICTSIGIAVAPVHANTVEDLVFVADKALRRAKEGGRNRVEVAV